jgi:hypothetical protein
MCSSAQIAADLLDAMNQRVVVAENGGRRRMTKRQAMIAQLVNKSATADLRATKMLLDMLRDIESQAEAASPLGSPGQRVVSAAAE